MAIMTSSISSWRAGLDRYPLSWRLLDGINAVVERCTTRRTAAATPLLFLLPALLLVALLVIGLVLIADQSLHVLNLDTLLPETAYSVANFAVIVTRSHYRELIGRTALAAILVAAMCLCLGFPYAYVMVRARSALTKKLLLCCVFLPFLLGGVVRGYAWLIILGQEGLVNSVLRGIGVPTIPLIYNMTGVLIGLVQLYLPVAVMMIAPALTAVHREIDEAAESLGAHWLRALGTVIIPMAAPGLVRAFIVVLTLVFSDMTIPAILGGGRADFITNAVYESYLETGDRGLGAALCIVTTSVAIGGILSLFLCHRLFARRPVAA
jgi:putative spermidine/putrescine transport system permease protein